ncbi:MAG: O-methyltransferase [Bacilli bacterium]|nr:O-methyltransferase [Bacilli bacterium]
MEKYAEENNVPIIEKDSLKFIINYIRTNNIKKILEIGTAIGYSSISMALAGESITVTTVERDETKYLEALKNIKKVGLDKRINLILGDALNINLDEKYDLIFIDAAKGQYIKFFEKYCQNLNDDGTIITDNIYFHGLVEKTEPIESKNLEQLVEKIRNYIIFLKENKVYKTLFYKIGDGLSVSKKRE